MYDPSAGLSEPILGSSRLISFFKPRQRLAELTLSMVIRFVFSLYFRGFPAASNSLSRKGLRRPGHFRKCSFYGATGYQSADVADAPSAVRLDHLRLRTALSAIALISHSSALSAFRYTLGSIL